MSAGSKRTRTVGPPTGVRTDCPQLSHQGESVPQRLDAAAGAVSPGDRHFPDAVTVLSGGSQNLNIKAPANLRTLQREKRPGSFGAETFAALCVLNSR